ncbi:PREDICTED: rotatin-like [Priapulus caudatus]|uniref:Rotatin-like n=1 Tax=Priapulus caudatus TaxID=37621 RepID=A0ABM1E654_PRICU|nr:PREDICTED: rotatin-like [Priapulus caudatus]
MEGLIEHLKDVQTHLTVEGLETRGTADRKEHYMEDLRETFNLLTSLMYQSQEAKEAAVHSHLSTVIHNLWVWCLVDKSVLAAALFMLCSFTSKHPSGSTSMVYSLTSNTGLQQKSHTNNCLGQRIVKLAISEQSKHVSNMQSLRLSFQLLGNMAISAECRCIMLKSNFWQGFLNAASMKKGRKQALESLWLELLVCVSFHADIQQAILKQKDFLDLLLGHATSGVRRQQRNALLVIRNLCFHTANKQKILAHDKLLHYLTEDLSFFTTDHERHLVVTALWTLSSNNQKGKFILKGTVLQRLQKFMEDLQPEQRDTELARDLQILIGLLLK